MNIIALTCKIEDCEKTVHARNLCDNHYRKAVRRKEFTLNTPEKHGLNKTIEYQTWGRMIQRCHNPKNPGFCDYGGRGITVCDEWRDSFATFYLEMGPKPTPRHSIDRLNVNLGYSKSNCRWATRSQQAVNKRISPKNTSGFRGVFFRKDSKRWRAVISYDYSLYHIGSYDTPLEAAYIRDQFAMQISSDLPLNFTY